MSALAQLTKALVKHSQQVAGLQEDKAQAFLALLRELRADLSGRLLEQGSQKIDAFNIRRILAQTESSIAVLERKGVVSFQEAVKQAAEMTAEQLGDELDLMAKWFDGDRLGVSLDAAKIIADPSQLLVSQHFQSSLQRYGIDVLNGVRREVFVGLQAGDSIGDVAAKVASKQGPLGEVGQANATRLVRTEVSQAFGAASHSGIVQASKKVPGLQKTWMHIGSYKCDVCMPLHGTQRPLDGTWTVVIGKKTREIAHPPAHPQCVCRTTAMKRSWADKLEKLGYLEQNPIDPRSKPTAL